jgi:uncharacterized membrane protein
VRNQEVRKTTKKMSTFYEKWAEKNEKLMEKYNIPYAWGGQTWECFDGCRSGCYKGCDRKCYACYILHDIYKKD